jgi:hypothetical protein
MVMFNKFHAKLIHSIMAPCLTKDGDVYDFISFYGIGGVILSSSPDAYMEDHRQSLVLRHWSISPTFSPSKSPTSSASLFFPTRDGFCILYFIGMYLGSQEHNLGL